ncbi:hypothetical protein GS682_32795 [Nostoc sp. B(2019)]|nr:hypothetical protein [Nostoc sp. B(2019)]
MVNLFVMIPTGKCDRTSLFCLKSRFADIAAQAMRYIWAGEPSNTKVKTVGALTCGITHPTIRGLDLVNDKIL